MPEAVEIEDLPFVVAGGQKIAFLTFGHCLGIVFDFIQPLFAGLRRSARSMSATSHSFGMVNTCMPVFCWPRVAAILLPGPSGCIAWPLPRSSCFRLCTGRRERYQPLTDPPW